jgi:small subunit ribosomal protein S14
MAKKSLVIRSNRTPKYRVRQGSRCRLCGRSGAYMRRFGLCRHCFRSLAHRGEIPGVTKASW